MYSRIALISSLLAVARGQQIGTLTAEVHPALTWETCTAPGECTTNNGQVVLDANWRYLHAVGSSTNCYTGNTWDTTLCPDDVTCAANCALDGAAYSSTYGVTTSGNAITLDFVTVSEQANVGSRLYLMASENEYEIFNVLNREFTFDVDVSHLPCGLNGALYMSTMPADGGMAEYPTNKAGAAYGTGYCDSQCPRDLKFIDGQANVEGWVPDSNNANTGVGNAGSCCAEMDIWEANSMSSAYTAHPCNTPTQTSCSGNACGGTYSTTRYAGTCDPDGCDFNSYRMGDTTFYGPGGTVNTNEVFTVVTQFLTNTGTASGTLSEIRRYYVQNGKVIPNSESTIPGVPGNSITPAYCTDESAVFNASGSFQAHGSLPGMSAGMSAGMVLVLSLWDDYDASMLWLDSNDPPTSPASDPGVARGSCAITSGVPAQVEADDPGAYVIYSNIRFGAFNSTFTGTWPSGTGPVSSSSSSSVKSSSTTTSAKPTTTTKATTTSTTLSTKKTTTTSTAASASSTATSPHWGQCGGIGWTGPTVCAAPYKCQPQANNLYYSQCL